MDTRGTQTWSGRKPAQSAAIQLVLGAAAHRNATLSRTDTSADAPLPYISVGTTSRIREHGLLEVDRIGSAGSVQTFRSFTGRVHDRLEGLHSSGTGLRGPGCSQPSRSAGQLLRAADQAAFPQTPRPAQAGLTSSGPAADAQALRDPTDPSYDPYGACSGAVSPIPSSSPASHPAPPQSETPRLDQSPLRKWR